MRSIRNRWVVAAFVLGSSLLAGCGGTSANTAVRSSGESVEKTASADGAPEPVELDETPLRGKEKNTLRHAIELMDDQEFDESIRLLEGLRKAHPKHAVILHELALAYRNAGKPNKAVDVLLPYSGGLPPMTIASLGSALDEADRPKDAFNLLRWAVTKYPESGLLFSELGVVLARLGDSEEALNAFQAGMEAEPSWPSNYLNSAKVNSNIKERGLAMYEGEIFRVLEPGSPRSKDMAKMIVRMYQEAVKIGPTGPNGKQSITISMSPGGLAPGPDGSPSFKGIFELFFGLDLIAAHERGLTIKSLHEARVGFLAKWFDPKTKISAEMREMPLFRLQRELQAAGHLEAYDYWLLAPAFPDEADVWMGAHGPQMLAMLHYMATHPMFAEPPKAKPKPKGTPV